MRQSLTMAAVTLAGVLSASAGVGEMKTKPLWDLADHGGPVAVSAAKPCEIPVSALPDSYAFTLELKYRFDDLTEHRYFTLVDQNVSNTGFGVTATTNPGDGKACNFWVNGQRYVCGWWFLTAKPGDVMTLTVTARGGWIVVYKDGVVMRSYMAKATPNLDPIRIGGPSSSPKKDPAKDLKGVTLLSAKLWDGSEEYYAPGEPHKRATGEMCGKGWMMTVPTEPVPDVPNVFYYGASISVGFTPALQRLSKGKANLYHWMSFIYNPGAKGVPVDAFLDIGRVANFDYLVVSNGGHSGHWTEERVPDAEVRASYRTLAQTLHRMAPKAKRIFYFLTTPRTRVAKGSEEQQVRLLKENPTIERLNRIAREEMEAEGISVIDSYSRFANRPELARGDGYHYTEPAYEEMAQMIWGAITEGRKN